VFQKVLVLVLVEIRFANAGKVLAISVPMHIFKKYCNTFYGSATVSVSLNGCWDPSVRCLGPRRFVTP